MSICNALPGVDFVRCLMVGLSFLPWEGWGKKKGIGRGGCHVRAYLVMYDSGFRRVCPAHPNLFLPVFLSTDSCCICNRSTLLIWLADLGDPSQTAVKECVDSVDGSSFDLLYFYMHSMLNLKSAHRTGTSKSHRNTPNNSYTMLKTAQPMYPMKTSSGAQVSSVCEACDPHGHCHAVPSTYSAPIT